MAETYRVHRLRSACSTCVSVAATGPLALLTLDAKLEVTFVRSSHTLGPRLRSAHQRTCASAVCLYMPLAVRRSGRRSGSGRRPRAPRLPAAAPEYCCSVGAALVILSILFAGGATCVGAAVTPPPR